MYRTDRTHVSYPYRPHIVPVPYPRPYPHPNPYQPSRTYHLAYRPTSKNATRALLLKLAKFVLFYLKCFWESFTTMDFAHKIGEFGLLGCCRDNIVEYTMNKWSWESFKTVSFARKIGEYLGRRGWCKNNIFEYFLFEPPLGNIKTPSFENKSGESGLSGVLQKQSSWISYSCTTPGNLNILIWMDSFKALGFADKIGKSEDNIVILGSARCFQQRRITIGIRVDIFKM